MNANEIADELEMVMDGYAIAITASGMLRQQQAEKEALEKLVKLQYEDAIVQGHEIEALRKELDTANKAYMWMDETYKGNLAEIRDLQQQVAFLEDYRAVWAPVIRQHQGLDK